MKEFKIIITVFLGILLFPLSSKGQVAPYSIPPKWYGGLGAGMNFIPGPTPTFMAGNPAQDVNQENSTTMVDSARNLVFYSNAYRLFDATNTQKQLVASGNSSTGGAISVPDPSDPANSFYLFTANVDGGGSSYNGTSPADGGGTISQGINYYRITKSGGTVNVTGPTNLAANNLTGEGIGAGSDGSNGYWIISHQGGSGGGSNYYKWHVTTTGVSAASTFAGTLNSFAWQQSIKISRCQNKIGFVHWSGGLEIYNWNATTGTLGSLIVSKANFTYGNLYGCEFSPDGSKFYFTELGGCKLYQMDLGTAGFPVVTVSSSSAGNVSELGTLQLGYDNKIYVVNASSSWGSAGSAVYMGVINDPNVAGVGGPGVGCDYVATGFQVKAAAGAYPVVYRGMANEAWMNPWLEIIETSSPCMKFNYRFKQYYGTAITVRNVNTATGEQWNFGDGNTGTGSSPSHSYGSNNNYTVTLTLQDDVCGNTWTTEKTITVSCVLPVKLIEFNVNKSGSSSLLKWATLTEENNSHFEIQHSADGINFTTIGTVKGNGNSSSVINYAFKHEFPVIGTNYYRLLQIDFDGKSEFSPIKALDFADSQFEVYPNPSSDNFNLKFTGAETAEIVLTDLAGKEVYKNSISNSDDGFQFGANLPQAMYILHINTEHESKTIKIEKK